MDHYGFMDLGHGVGAMNFEINRITDTPNGGKRWRLVIEYNGQRITGFRGTRAEVMRAIRFYAGRNY